LLFMIALFILSILIEFVYGLKNSSFHLMVDSFHNILNVLALCFSLFAAIWGKVGPNSKYTYGFSRLEIIASFAHCCFLNFLGIFLVFRSIHGSLEHWTEDPNHEHHERGHDALMIFSFLRLILNLMGCFIFSLYSRASSEEVEVFSSFFGPFAVILRFISHNKKYDGSLQKKVLALLR